MSVGIEKVLAESDPDLLLGPKRHWCTQHELMLNRKFHREMIENATSYIGRQTEEHRIRMAKVQNIFSTSTAKQKSLRSKELAITADNKRLLQRLLKVEMQQTEITRTNINCPEKQLYRMRRRQRKRATRAAKQFKIDKINKENKIMLKRLKKAKSSFDFQSMEKSFAQHRSRMKVMSKVRDPKKIQKHHKQKLAALKLEKQYSRMDVSPSFDDPYDDSLLTMLWKAKNAVRPHASNRKYKSQPVLRPPVQSPMNRQDGSVIEDPASTDVKDAAIPDFASMEIPRLRRVLIADARRLSPAMDVNGFRSLVHEMPKPALVNALTKMWETKLAGGLPSIDMKGSSRLFESSPPSLPEGREHRKPREKRRRRKKGKRRKAKRTIEM